MKQAQHSAFLRPAHEPSAEELRLLVRDIGRGIAESMDLLAGAPTAAKAQQVHAQLSGATLFVTKFKAALAREAAQ